MKINIIKKQIFLHFKSLKFTIAKNNSLRKSNFERDLEFSFVLERWRNNTFLISKLIKCTFQ